MILGTTNDKTCCMSQPAEMQYYWVCHIPCHRSHCRPRPPCIRWSPCQSHAAQLHAGPSGYRCCKYTHEYALHTMERDIHKVCLTQRRVGHTRFYAKFNTFSVYFMLYWFRRFRFIMQDLSPIKKKKFQFKLQWKDNFLNFTVHLSTVNPYNFIY